METREVHNKFPFELEIPNEPYIDNFSEGKTHPAYYTGLRFLKFQVENQSGLIKNCCAEAQTMEELDGMTVYPEDNHHIITIDAQEHPWECSYLTHNYEHDDVPWYEEDLGTTDAEGNPEVWRYTWGHVLNQIYYNQQLKYINNAFIKPPFRLHQHSQEAFEKSVIDHIEMTDRELAREGVYKPDEIQAIQKYKEQLQEIQTKYTGIHHWKIPFPALPLIKP